MTSTPTFAYFITDHGFGHASRAAAVMAAMQRVSPRVRFELFTTCPRWIFEDSLQGGFGYQEVRADVGMVQRSPLEADLDATLRELEGWMPFDTTLIDRLAQAVTERQCRVVVCDISPLGVAVAKSASLPCVLIENFTWDWIYAPYLRQVPALAVHAEFFRNIYDAADLRIQTEPLCRAVDGAVRVAPISRAPRTAPEALRARLNIPTDARMVLVSMGGVPDRFQFLERLPAVLDAFIVIPGAGDMPRSHEKVIPLPARSGFFHPDLLRAADLLIGKAGYSTIAEAFHTGVPFGYIARTQSPESPALERFITACISSRPISTDDYTTGRWMEMLPELLALPRGPPAGPNGADEVSRLLWERYG